MSNEKPTYQEPEKTVQKLKDEREKRIKDLLEIYTTSSRSSRMSVTTILSSTSNTFTASSRVVTQNGQAVVMTSTPRSSASLTRFREGLFSGVASSVQTLPAPLNRKIP